MIIENKGSKVELTKKKRGREGYLHEPLGISSYPRLTRMDAPLSGGPTGKNEQEFEKVGRYRVWNERDNRTSTR